MLLRAHVWQKLKQEIQHGDESIPHQQYIWEILCLLPHTLIAKLGVLSVVLNSVQISPVKHF